MLFNSISFFLFLPMESEDTNLTLMVAFNAGKRGQHLGGYSYNWEHAKRARAAGDI